MATTACATAGGPGEDDPACAWNVCLRRTENPRRVVYRLENRGPAPATVRLTFRRLENLRAREDLPIERSVAPRSTVVIATLDEVVSGRSRDAIPVLHVDLGSPETVHDENVLYQMPFGGTAARELLQGFGGWDSHAGGMYYSLDFAMPEGTPILAARAGEVLYIQDGFTEGGTDPDLLERANIVVVLHEDGTMASYGHLRPGVAVEVGQRVAVGERLAWSGATGFAGQPHLHFHVGRRLLGDPGRTLEIRLAGADGSEVRLVEGNTYSPAAAHPPGTD